MWFLPVAGGGGPVHVTLAHPVHVWSVALEEQAKQRHTVRVHGMEWMSS